MPPKKKNAKKTNDYEMAEFIEKGTVIKDVRKNEFVVGEPVGQGGFGMIYLTDLKGNKNDLDNAKSVIKIEPKKNGPLFTEVNYYMRNCKPDDIDKFSKTHKLTVLGIPKFISQGIHTYNKNDLRYLIMPRFGRDLNKLFIENGNKFSREFCAQIAVKMLYAIQYMHEKRYAHADIKGANILLGNENTKEKEELFLIDFGLAYLIPNNVVHKPDPRCKHDGTIEYCSTDAHDGSKPSFRGDLQILCWCLAHWAGGDLPWLKLIKENMVDADKEKVANLKRAAADKSDKFLKDLGILSFKEIKELLEYSTNMDYGEEIDFDECRKMFKSVLPKSKSLALQKVKSRKSFVKIDTLTAAKDMPKRTETPKRKAPKSLKRTVQEESSKDEEDQLLTAKKPVRKQAKRTTKTPAKKKVESEPEEEETDSFEITKPAETSSLRRTRNSTRNSSRNSTLQFEVDDEVSINPAPIKRTSKKLSKLQEESTDKINDSKVKKQSVVEEPSILEDDDESSEGETLDESVLIQQDVTKDIVKKSAFNETTVHDPETGDEDSGDDSMSESGSLEKEIVDEEPKIAENVLISRENIPPGPTKAKKPKRMLQPGKLENPTDCSSQTIRKSGRINSWLQANPEKLAQLRKFLRGEAESYKI